MPKWTNWSGSVVCSPTQIAAPNTEDELAALLSATAPDNTRGATGCNTTVRIAGTGHSFVPLCASDELLVSLDNLQGVINTDRESCQATVWAGTKIHQLGEPLLIAGLGMANMGDIDRQSIAGAIGTGTHGTGRDLGSISTQVVALHLLNGEGERVVLSAEDGERFGAAQLSLGALGVITRVTLQLLPAFRLHERTWVEPFEDCLARLDEEIDKNEHFEFFWVPSEDVCAMKTLNPTVLTEVPATATKPQVEGRLARYIGEERVDWSSRIFPSSRDVRFNEMEFAVPAPNGPDCLREIRQLMQQKFPDVVWPIEYRTLAADDIPLSPAFGRPTVTISIHQAAELPYNPFFLEAEAIFRSHHGRPHWGKIHTHTAQELATLYPKWGTFQAVRQALDPKGRFLNPYLQTLFE